MQQAALLLEDGSQFIGQAFGHISHHPSYSVGEVVFNTSMTGYQEILSDPSYAHQLVTLTYPHIGNVGINLDDFESSTIHARGLIVRQLPYAVSNWRAQESLNQLMAQQHVLGICDIDTRRLTRIIRQKGAQKACIVAAPELNGEILQQAQQQIKAFKGLRGSDLAQEVTTRKPYIWQEGGTWQNQSKPNNRFHVVALDFGIKKTILRCLQDSVGQITVVPATTTAAEILNYAPDGVFLSNGPGDPDPCDYAIQTIQTLLQQNIPLFGICLGFQLLSLASKAQTFKMKYGHHGGNHPVRCEQSHKVFITSQNHGFAVQEPLPAHLSVTHRSLFDNTIQGLAHTKHPAFGFQGHPEAGPGPNDLRLLFEQFVNIIHEFKTLSTPVQEWVD